jgi:uncharacterized protein
MRMNHRILSCAVGSFWLLTSAAAVNGQDCRQGASDPNAYTGPIIDVHLHAYTEADFRANVPSPAGTPPAPASAREHLERTLDVMRRCNVVLGAVSGSRREAALTWHAQAPDRVLRGWSLDAPGDFPDAETFRELARSGALDVLGEIGAQYAGYSPSDPAYGAYWAIAQDHGIPVGVHTGQSFPGMPYRGRPNFRLRYGDPLLLEDMLVEYPRLKVYMMHAGGGGHFSGNALMMLGMYPQLYVDISLISWMPGTEAVLEPFLTQAKQMRMLDRVMFGTDQMLWPETIELAIQRINGLDFLTVEEKAGIFYGNAARFLGLSEEAIAEHRAAHER